MKCPEENCGGELVEKRTRKGRTFFSCSSYPDCDFALWNTPVNTICPRCGYPLLEKRKKGTFCPRCRKKIDTLEDGSFFVYPNPVSDGAGIVRFHPGEECTWEIRIFNMAGELVTFENGNAPGGAAWEVPWETSDLAPGIYLVTLRLETASGPMDALFHAAVVN